MLTCVAGCQSLSGRYVPSCPAYEGDTIEFSGDRFTWDKFTDQVRIDEHGETIDPFPGFPKTGGFTLSGTQLDLKPDDGGSTHTYYLLSLDGESYLLNAAEQGRYAVDGVIDRCALRRSSDSSE